MQPIQTFESIRLPENHGKDAGRVAANQVHLRQRVHNTELYLSDKHGSWHKAKIQEWQEGDLLLCRAAYEDTGQPFVPTENESQQLPFIRAANGGIHAA